MATPAPATAVADTSAFGGPNATQAAAANAQLATSKQLCADHGTLWADFNKRSCCIAYNRRKLTAGY